MIGVIDYGAGNLGSVMNALARLARLESPLRVFDKLEAARNSVRSLYAVIAEQAPLEPARFTPVPLQ
jgi:imidazoleglycerol phosphate synthase glutamine amidotransferase subunit HisH